MIIIVKKDSTTVPHSVIFFLMFCVKYCLLKVVPNGIFWVFMLIFYYCLIRGGEVYIRSCVTVKRFEKISLNFSILLFVIRVNLLHP